MKIILPLKKEQKLTVIFRIESGCLGPKGEDLIEKFCHFAQKEVASIDSDFVIWEIVPRDEKFLPEMQYKINKKILTHDKAAKYLEMFKKNLDEFEDHIHKKLSYLIDQHLGY